MECPFWLNRNRTKRYFKKRLYLYLRLILNNHTRYVGLWGKILLIVLYLLRTEQAEELPLYFHYLLHFAFKQAKNEPYEDECQHQCIISNHCDKKKNTRYEHYAALKPGDSYYKEWFCYYPSQGLKSLNKASVSEDRAAGLQTAGQRLSVSTIVHLDFPFTHWIVVIFDSPRWTKVQ